MSNLAYKCPKYVNPDTIITIHIPVMIGFFGGHGQSFRIKINEFKKYFDLSEDAILRYACKINSNFREFNKKHEMLAIKRSRHAAKYQGLVENKEYKNLSEPAQQ